MIGSHIDHQEPQSIAVTIIEGCNGDEVAVVHMRCSLAIASPATMTHVLFPALPANV
jgi:hypothetical protein